MGLFKTLKNVFRGAINDVDKSLQNHERDGEISIIDAKKQTAQFRTNIAELLANTKLQEKKRDDAKAQVKQWNGVLNKAIDAEDEAGAKVAHGKVQAAESQVAVYTKQIKQNDVLLDTMKSNLEKMTNKVASAENKLANLKATSQSSKLRQQMAKNNSSIAGSGFLADLDKFEENVDEETAKADALEELSGEDNASEDVLDKYTSNDTGFDFAALKASRKK